MKNNIENQLFSISTLFQELENNPTNLPILIENKYKTSDGYSGNFYNIQSGMINGVLYPALDPSIFEVKYPNSDVQGKVLGDNLGTQG